MRERAEAMVIASFVADTHALGAHWIYDIAEIESRFGRVEHLLPAAPGSFHAGRLKGAFTHYGDQALLLLRHLADAGRFDLAAFAREWRRLFDRYDGYIDRATRQTLEAIDRGADPAGACSDSDDLGGCARIAPLAYLHREDLDALVRSSRSQTAFTHGDPLAVDAAEFLARVAWHALNGKPPSAVIPGCARETGSDRLLELVARGLTSAGRPTAKAAAHLGQHGSVTAALPLAVHLIATYEGSLKEALINNVGAGGDSAARGMAIGMILGAFHGREAIPDDWIEDMRAFREISGLLEDLEACLKRTVRV